MAIGGNVAKTESLVQALCIAHLRQRVEIHASITERARIDDEALGEGAADTGASERRAHEQPLHLAARVIERTQCAATGDRAVVAGEQQAAARWRVGAGQAGKFGVEVLEAEVDTERCLILREQRACRSDGLALPGDVDGNQGFGGHPHDESGG